MSDIVQKIKLSIYSVENKFYELHFYGDVIKNTDNLGNISYKFNVLKNPEKMSKIINIIGDIFMATFYVDGVPLVSGGFKYDCIKFSIAPQKNVDRIYERVSNKIEVIEIY